MSVFSFHAVKIVTTAEGGIVTTQDARLARRLQLLRSHGMTREASELTRPTEGPWVYEQQQLGFNYRLTDIQAALGLSQLSRLDSMHNARLARARRYDERLDGLPLIRPVRLDDRVSACHLYVIEIDDNRSRRARAAVFAALRAEGVGVNVHYIPIHTQPYYAALGFRHGDFPMAERYYARALSLPLFPALTDAQQDRVVAALERALAD
jgi:dTDP-4-amino-4,6-dideoxygalactose transaminase